MAEKQYIEREAVMKIIDKYGTTHGGVLGSHSGTVDVVGDIIYHLPVADVAPVKHGEWEGRIHGRFYGTDEDGEPIYRDGVVYYCSECRHRSIIKTNFCPNCGTKNDV